MVPPFLPVKIWSCVFHSRVFSVPAKAAWYNQRRLYRQLRRRKCSEFWQRKLKASKADPRGLWKTADALLGRGRTPASSAINVEVFKQFFAEIAKVRSNTSDASLPMYSRARPGVSLRHLSPLTIDDIVDAVRNLPDKSSAAD